MIIPGNRLKSYTARRLIDLLREKGARLFLERMEMLRQKLEYIHNNPVKRGFVDAPEHWRWSSARGYAGGRGVVEVYTGW
ncbi:MAG: hypothetical protein KFB96_24850 [Thiocapsa sp.]|uniref:hypothetical protein n=1 Tax=Thiocapsa sp. TaxID=2024551 RepID=UPI001BCF6B55|nr:hypothetical protein [Thiocapsa sp.]QVL48741.1 MAG: hypothetical protein KFB96_24850 [Thiocapsa sp.]